jgi:hypothetical protein
VEIINVGQNLCESANQMYKGFGTKFNNLGNFTTVMLR